MLYVRSRAACLSRKSIECDGIELKNGCGSLLSFLSYRKERNPFKVTYREGRSNFSQINFFR